MTLCTFDLLDSRNADDMSVKMGSGLREVRFSGGTAANGPPGLADAFSCPDGPRPGPKRTSTAEMARPAAISAHTVSHSTPSSMSAMRSAIETVGSYDNRRACFTFWSCGSWPVELPGSYARDLPGP